MTALGGNWSEALPFGLAGLVFCGFGVGGLVAVRAGSRKANDQLALQAAHPDAPWLWREDWVSGRINDSSVDLCPADYHSKREEQLDLRADPLAGGATRDRETDSGHRRKGNHHPGGISSPGRRGKL